MKYIGLIFGAAVLAIAALTTRGSAPQIRVRRAEERARHDIAVDKPPLALRAGAEIRGREAREEREDRGPRDEPKAAPLLPAQEELVNRLEHVLALTVEARRFIETVLAERAQEIEEYNRQVHASGVFSAEEYDRRIRKIQRASYERMETVLDDVQRRRFAELLSENRLGDAVVFTLDPGMTQVDND